MAVYLDYNASAPIDERVLDRMIEIYRSHYGNADSRTHIFGTDVKEIVSSSSTNNIFILHLSLRPSAGSNKIQIQLKA